MWNFEYVQEVQKALEEIGRVCPRCVLRLGGVKVYQLNHSNLKIFQIIFQLVEKEFTTVGKTICKSYHV